MSANSIAAEIADISSLPHVALRVIEVARDPDAGASDLKNVVEGDPSLSARVLKLVNSASMGMTRTVSNLQQAISFLGFSQVRNLALTASVSEVFKSDKKLGNYRRPDLWRHMVAVGVSARFLAMRRSLPNFDDAFLAGLLHDIGIVLEDQHAHTGFEQVMLETNESEELVETERRVLGFNHCQLGALVAESWKFPETVRESIRHHHASERCTGAGAPIVQIVELANVICTLKGISSVGKKLLRSPIELLKRMEFDRDDLIVLATDLDDELKRNASLFEA